MRFVLFILCAVQLFSAPKIMVGIAGGTGSGKTTIAQKLHEVFADNSVLISQDSYYRNRLDLTFDQRAELNFDSPDALEFSLLREHLLDLKAGNAIDQPTYNFAIHAREAKTVTVEPADIVIVEVMLLLASDEVKDLFDLKIFVDTDADVRVIRRIERDIRERGRDLLGVQKQYLATVKPMHEKYVEPSKKYADVIIPEGGYNETAINLIITGIANELKN